MEKEHEIRCLEYKGQYMSGSRTTTARELARYTLDLVGVLEDRWDKGDTVGAGY